MTEALKNIPLNRVFCSPYRRSVDTIRECAAQHGLEIVMDERLRERISGSGCNTRELINGDSFLRMFDRIGLGSGRRKKRRKQRVKKRSNR